MKTKKILRNVFCLSLGIWMLGQGWHLDLSIEEGARKYTRAIEFNYLEWTLNTLWLKSTHLNNGNPASTPSKQAIFNYLRMVKDIQILNEQIEAAYVDPNINNPESLTITLSTTLTREMKRLDDVTPKVESVLQDQVRQVLIDKGVVSGSIVFPPVLYHSSDVPLSLFLSPREKIELLGNISLQSPLSEESKVRLENQIESGMPVSALIEPVGGLATYPTMVMLTTDLNWLVDTIAHEWTHNYLSLHSLGMNYDSSPDLRTMNETVASLAGAEIGHAVIASYYPELLQKSTAPSGTRSDAMILDKPFNFRNEMRITRIEVDRLLAEGSVDLAEAYMESRRRIFWENGFLIRRINQAYFAFYGAYNDVPGGGASGEDPVGPAVVRLRALSASLGDFLRLIARISSYEELVQVLDSMRD